VAGLLEYEVRDAATALTNAVLLDADGDGRYTPLRHASSLPPAARIAAHRDAEGESRAADRADCS
jgi:hypothetical protein